MKKYIIISIITLIAVSCRKKVEVKFLPGIYEFTSKLYITTYYGEVYYSHSSKFPVKLLSANNEELKMQCYSAVEWSEDTLFYGVATFHINKKKGVEGILYRGNSLETKLHFTNGEIIREEDKSNSYQIIGDINYKIAIDYGFADFQWSEVAGTYTFSKKE